MIQGEGIIGMFAEVLVREKEGRTADSDFTLFDAAGIPSEDIALAWEVSIDSAKEDWAGCI